MAAWSELNLQPKKELQPLFLGYMENNLYTAGYFQALVTLPASTKCNMITWKQATSTSYQRYLRQVISSTIFLTNLFHSSILETEFSPMKNQAWVTWSQPSTEGSRRETPWPPSKKSKLDSTSLKSVCHVCHFKLSKNNVKKKSFCRKLVNNSCFLADGSMCKWFLH